MCVRVLAAVHIWNAGPDLRLGGGRTLQDLFRPLWLPDSLELVRVPRWMLPRAEAVPEDKCQHERRTPMNMCIVYEAEVRAKL